MLQEDWIKNLKPRHNLILYLYRREEDMSAMIRKDNVIFISYVAGKTKEEAMNIINFVSREMNFYEHYGHKISECKDDIDLQLKIQNLNIRPYPLSIKKYYKRKPQNRYKSKFYTIDSQPTSC